ncbi:hypothetical protein C8Q75DRAFT_895681 [Abortiporus biennis]|nr:hypothetical protein C8Q75DRAFT_895681 [Abortiporus biennis]
MGHLTNCLRRQVANAGDNILQTSNPHILSSSAPPDLDYYAPMNLPEGQVMMGYPTSSRSKTQPQKFGTVLSPEKSIVSQEDNLARASRAPHLESADGMLTKDVLEIDFQTPDSSYEIVIRKIPLIPTPIKFEDKVGLENFHGSGFPSGFLPDSTRMEENARNLLMNAAVDLLNM